MTDEVFIPIDREEAAAVYMLENFDAYFPADACFVRKLRAGDEGYLGNKRPTFGIFDADGEQLANYETLEKALLIAEQDELIVFSLH